jgi:hypothetical protein
MVVFIITIDRSIPQSSPGCARARTAQAIRRSLDRKTTRPELFPSLDEQLDPFTAKLERLIVILDTLGLDAYVAPTSRGPGRPANDRPQIARAFVASSSFVPRHVAELADPASQAFAADTTDVAAREARA